MTTEPPRSSISALIRVSGLPPSPSGAPENARMRASAAPRQRALVGQSIPEPDEDFGQKADARGRRAVMRLARPGARHVGGVPGGEVEPAGAVAEQVQGLGRQRAGGVEVAPLAARLEQRERGAGQRRIVVDEGAGAGMSLAPGVQKPPVVATKMRAEDGEIEDGRPRGLPAIPASPPNAVACTDEAAMVKPFCRRGTACPGRRPGFERRLRAAADRSVFPQGVELQHFRSSGEP